MTIFVQRSAALVLFCVFALCSCSKKAKTISATEAKDHVGEDATVCGMVYQVRLVKSGNVFLDIGGDHPKQPFTVVCMNGAIPYESLKHFEGLAVCVTGKIRESQGKQRIAINSLNQIISQSEPQ